MGAAPDIEAMCRNVQIVTVALPESGCVQTTPGGGGPAGTLTPGAVGGLARGAGTGAGTLVGSGVRSPGSGAGEIGPSKEARNALTNGDPAAGPGECVYPRDGGPGGRRGIHPEPAAGRVGIQPLRWLRYLGAGGGGDELPQ